MQACCLDASNRAGFVAVRSVPAHSDSADEAPCLISHQHASGDRDEIPIGESNERIDKMWMAFRPRGERATSDAHVERPARLAASDALAQETGAVLTGVCNQAAAGIEDGDRRRRKGLCAGVPQAVLDNGLRVCECDQVGHGVQSSGKLNW
jgi:hypothetical protein